MVTIGKLKDTIGKLSTNVISKRTPMNRALTLKILLIGAVILVIISLGVATSRGAKKAAITVHQPATKKITRVLPTITISHDGDQVTAAGHTYINALIQGQYDVMWSMLHPQIQAMWPDKATFANYWKMRFHGYKLRSASFGTVSHRTYWIDPETMMQYNQVEVMPISLQLDPDLPAQQLEQLAPQFQQPSQLFQNLPFIVQNHPGENGQSDQWLVLGGGPADPEAPLLPPTMPMDTTVRVPILMYHYISAVPDNDPNPRLRQSLSVSPQLFGQQLDYLKSKGYHSITFNQLMNALYYQVPLPINPIILTFDDGYIDGYQNAYPILKAHGFSGMFYIITSKVGWHGQASWPQLQEMLLNGMQMGSHTVHHVNMGTTYLRSPEQALQEVQVSQFDMQQHLGIIIQHFCYPNGDPFKGTNVFLQQKVVALLAANGYIDATTDPGPTGVIQRASAPFVLLRLRIDGRSSLQYFTGLLQSYALPV